VSERELLLRAVLLYFPVIIAVGLWLWRRPSRREATGALLATAWNVPALLAVNVLAERAGWWRFGVDTGTVLGVPGDLWLGWSLWWGVCAVLARLPAPVVVIVALVVDLVAMPTLSPLVELGSGWLVGEAVALSVVLVPAVLLGAWTRDDRRLEARVALQMVAATGLMVGLVPVAVAELRGLDAPARAGWLNAFLIQIAALPAIFAFTAVREFAVRGRGTPIPYDPPRTLVVSGPYAYVANPMQLSMLLAHLLMALALWNPWPVAAAVVGFAYSAGLAAWHEDADLAHRFGTSFRRYRRSVRRWVPRWWPYPPPQTSVLYVAATCATCSSLARFFEVRSPVGLTLAAAEDVPELRLERVTYIAPGGLQVSGVRAFARALDHLHLAWALLGWTLRLPLVWRFVQVIGDASGAGPRRTWGLSADTERYWEPCPVRGTVPARGARAS